MSNKWHLGVPRHCFNFAGSLSLVVCMSAVNSYAQVGGKEEGTTKDRSG